MIVKQKEEDDTPVNIAAHYSQAGVDAYNAMRAKYGLPALKHNPELDAVAITRANEIITKFDHVSASHAKTKYENAHADKSWDILNESLEKTHLR